MSKYIAIEGLEGAGKSTAMRAITDHLESKNQTVKSFNEFTEMVREPGGTVLAEILRGLVKGEDPRQDPKEEITPYTEALLFFAARNQLLTNKVAPALEAGKIVISDRCYLSSVAYQRDEPQLIKDLVKNLHHKPDLIIYLDLDPRIGLERARGRGALDRIELRDISFFDEAREVYQSEAKTNKNIVTVDASQSIEDVYKSVTKVLVDYDQSLLSKKKQSRRSRPS